MEEETDPAKGGNAVRFSRQLNLVDAHPEGESGKVVVGSVGPVPGDTMFDNRLYFMEYLDHLRKLLLCEPRGAVWHNANVVLPGAGVKGLITQANHTLANADN